MPLHKIPLCDFKYAGEVHSGAAFKYNTAVQILKYRPRVLSKEIKEIQRNKTNISNKVLYKSTVSIFKNSKKYLYKKLYEINTKKFAMELRLSNRDINKESIFSLKAQNIDFIKGSGIELEKNNVLMDMESSVYFESGYLNFIKNSSLELKTPNISMNVITDKSLQSPESKIIDVGESINLFRRWQNGIYKKSLFAFFNRQELSLNLFNPIFVRRPDSKEFYKDELMRQTVPKKDWKINKLVLEKDFRRITLKHINFINYKYGLRRNALKSIIKGCSMHITSKFNERKIKKEIRNKMIYRDVSERITKIAANIFMPRNSYKGIYKANHCSLSRILFNSIFKDNFNKLLKRQISNDISYSNVFGVTRVPKIDIIRNLDKYLGRISSVDVYRQAEKGICK